jgi:acyl-CoA synthetase (AMP-forming)/AMP-acid ligase II
VARGRLASCGRLVPGIEVEVRDGEIWVRGEQVSGEYLGKGSAVDDDGWFPTRDRGWVDDEGYLFIEGRSDDTIIRGGENIAPAEIEDVLLEHPAVAQAAVVGLPDEEWGQRLAAAVVLRPGQDVDADGLRAFARERLRSSKTPELIAFRDDLPMTDTGKLLRRVVLADLAAEAQEG